MYFDLWSLGSADHRAITSRARRFGPPPAHAGSARHRHTPVRPAAETRRRMSGPHTGPAGSLHAATRPFVRRMYSANMFSSCAREGGGRAGRRRHIIIVRERVPGGAAGGQREDDSMCCRVERSGREKVGEGEVICKDGEGGGGGNREWGGRWGG